MSKEKTLKEIRETTRNEVASQYKKEIKILEDKIDKLYNKNQELNEKYNQEHNLRLEQEEKLNQYEDWIQRLQDFCNLTDEDRVKAIEDFKNELNQKEKSKEFATHLNSLFDNSFLFNMLKIF